MTKNQIFQNFFYLFPHKHLQIYTITKIARIFDQPRRFALLRGTPALWDAPFAIPSGSFLSRRSLGEGGFQTTPKKVNTKREMPFNQLQWSRLKIPFVRGQVAQ